MLLRDSKNITSIVCIDKKKRFIQFDVLFCRECTRQQFRAPFSFAESVQGELTLETGVELVRQLVRKRKTSGFKIQYDCIWPRVSLRTRLVSLTDEKFDFLSPANYCGQCEPVQLPCWPFDRSSLGELDVVQRVSRTWCILLTKVLEQTAGKVKKFTKAAKRWSSMGFIFCFHFPFPIFPSSFFNIYFQFSISQFQFSHLLNLNL